MSTSANFDAIEQLIHDEGLKIESLEFRSDDFFVKLNTGARLHFPLSFFNKLITADHKSLVNYEIIAAGTGVHWPDLDEDLSLKGFMQEALKQTVKNAAA